ncbi:DUF4242 domain-containing protein [Amycolatopsis granulosa]|uniref:DUF4242 domain-containing protein n=1 Tax=Amycolatopsis granulosa TaxID=185684 RepID=UPI0014202F6F|nr:DUF4242 domain-containing protein [Amycolatopsis granulosa]NIH84014.1 hypothetical protein [Amycolatopsis granulosa]
MTLYLFEVVPADAGREAAAQLLERLGKAAVALGAELIESQVTADHGRVFAVVEAGAREAADQLRTEIETDTTGVREVSAPAEVRLVGADLAEVKAARPRAGYLVEWDLPATLDMDSYLARKKANAPRYADVPEVQFLRTYVREDMVKCLCFYDAPGEDLVRAARAAVDTPVDRLHALDDPA